MNEHIEKLRNNKWLVIILIIGLVMLIFPSLTQKDDKSDSAIEVDYEKGLETRLEEMLCNIQGAGDVRVMVTLCDDGIAYPVVDKNTTQTQSQEKNVIVSGEVATLYRTKPKIQGVVVVASGGDDPKVQEALSGAVSALCDVPMHNIKVYTLGQRD